MKEDYRSDIRDQIRFLSNPGKYLNQQAGTSLSEIINVYCAYNLKIYYPILPIERLSSNLINSSRTENEFKTMHTRKPMGRPMRLDEYEDVSVI